MKMIKIIPVILLGVILSGNVRAANTHNEGFRATVMTSLNMESWMFDTNYLSNVALTVEDWMFDQNWLVQPNEKPAVEGWMMDESYLSDAGRTIEPWMLDAGYLERKSDNVN